MLMRRLVKPFAILMIILLALPALAALGETPSPSPAPVEPAPIETQAPARDQSIHVDDDHAAGAPVNPIIDHSVGKTSAPTRMALS